MRAARPVPTILLLCLCFYAVGGFAAEVAELRNGFSIPHRSREMRPGMVRLYTDDAKKSFIDLPAEEIQGYSIQPDPEPVAVAPAPQVSAATSQPQLPAQAKIAAASLPAQKSTEQIVSEASKLQGVDSDFIHSVIQQESSGNPRAVSRAGARGLMQLMPGTASQLGVANSFSPEQNVHGGTRYLRELLERYHGDAVKALAAYNAGPGAVDRYRGVPPYRETRLYVQRIVRQYNRKKGGDADQAAAKHNSGVPARSSKRVPGQHGKAVASLDATSGPQS
jgi:soluble lytic murein transglycosylase-like protein